MKVLKFKLTIAVLCSIAIIFTACSKEEIKTNNSISANNVASKQIQSGEIAIDKNTNTDKWIKVDDKYLEDLATSYANRIDDLVPTNSDCNVTYCLNVGPKAMYRVIGGAEGDFQFYEGQYCFEITAPAGAQRDVEYEGRGGVQVFLYNINCYPCIVWDVAPTPDIHTEDEKTFTISCTPM